MARARVGASLVPPRVAAESDGPEPIALLSSADRDKSQLVDLARALRKAGYRLPAPPRAFFRDTSAIEPSTFIRSRSHHSVGYPAGTGSALIFRSIPVNSRRVRWLSASSNQ